MEHRRNGRYYLDNCWYLVPDGNGEYDVFDDGEYEGKYVGAIKTLDEMTQDEALDYVLSAL